MKEFFNNKSELPDGRFLFKTIWDKHFNPIQLKKPYNENNLYRDSPIVKFYNEINKGLDKKKFEKMLLNATNKLLKKLEPIIKKEKKPNEINDYYTWFLEANILDKINLEVQSYILHLFLLNHLDKQKDLIPYYKKKIIDYFNSERVKEIINENSNLWYVMGLAKDKELRVHRNKKNKEWRESLFEKAKKMYFENNKLNKKECLKNAFEKIPDKGSYRKHFKDHFKSILNTFYTRF